MQQGEDIIQKEEDILLGTEYIYICLLGGYRMDREDGKVHLKVEL